jgi:putative transposase
MRFHRNRATFLLNIWLTIRVSFSCGFIETALPLQIMRFHRNRATCITAMNFRRKSLPHDVPDWIDPMQEAYFVTINCMPRGVNQLAMKPIWSALIESIEFREKNGEWKWRLILAMPDHLHGIVTFPHSYFMRKSISSWKRWIAKSHSVKWQRDFFDHRLRSHESASEKAKYIRMNPVRTGLVSTSDEWPFVR